MNDWRTKADQDLTATDVAEMRAAAVEATPGRALDTGASATATTAEPTDADLAQFIRLPNVVAQARQRAAQLMDSPRETQAWRDGAMMLGLASELAAQDAWRVRAENAEHLTDLLHDRAARAETEVERLIVERESR